MARAGKDGSQEVYRFMVGLTNYEELAVSLVRPFNVNTMQPVALQATDPQKRAIVTYFRVMLSSAGQGVYAAGAGRNADWLLMDQTSGAFLGLWSFCDISACYTSIKDWLGGVTLVGKPGTEHPATLMHVQQVKRCLPLYDFGQLTGGKLMILLALSTEVQQVHEHRYSFPVTTMVIRTLHGKSSQYNRLHQRGINYMGTEADGKGLYLTTLHDNSVDFLLGKAARTGRRVTYSFEEQVAYWRERWLPNKINLTDDGWVRPDPNKYRLSAHLQEKMKLRLEGAAHD